MGRAICADQPGAIHGEAHRQRLQRHIMHDLVIGALQKGRINRAKGLEPFGSKPSRESHRMLFGNANIKTPAREFLRE